MAAQAAAQVSKEIRRFKLALNSACPLRCSYCFIDKDAGEVLPEAEALAAVDLALESPGASKKLLIYGGEPFLQFGLLEKVVLHARARAAGLGKALSISVATSGLYAEPGRLRFLREQRVQLAVSLDGSAEAHDASRRFGDGSGSFARIRANLETVFRELPARGVIALLGVPARSAARMEENFRALVALGFENVNIEVIHGLPWSRLEELAFRTSLERICAFILERAQAGRGVYLESVYKSLHELSSPSPAAKACPFHSFLEVFPGGEYSFYPFPFVAGLPERPRAAVGSVREGFEPRWAECRFDAASDLCKGCMSGYYKLVRLDQGSEPYRARAELSASLARTLARRAPESPAFKAYLREALLRDALGFS